MAEFDYDELPATMQAVVDRIPENWGRYISCGSGWFPLIAGVDRELALIDPDYKVLQVKEKFGGLRFYYEPTPGRSKLMLDAMRAIVHSAEATSFTICEETGRPGVLMRKKGGHWIRTLDPEAFADDWEVMTSHPIQDAADELAARMDVDDSQD